MSSPAPTPGLQREFRAQHFVLKVFRGTKNIANSHSRLNCEFLTQVLIESFSTGGFFCSHIGQISTGHDLVLPQQVMVHTTSEVPSPHESCTPPALLAMSWRGHQEGHTMKESEILTSEKFRRNVSREECFAKSVSWCQKLCTGGFTVVSCVMLTFSLSNSSTSAIAFATEI